MTKELLLARKAQHEADLATQKQIERDAAAEMEAAQKKGRTARDYNLAISGALQECNFQLGEIAKAEEAAALEEKTRDREAPRPELVVKEG